MPNARVKVRGRVPFGGIRLADDAVISVYVGSDDQITEIDTIPVPAHGGRGRVWPQVAAALANTRWRFVPRSYECIPRSDWWWHFTVEEADEG